MMPTTIDNLQPSVAVTEAIVNGGLFPAREGGSGSSSVMASIRHFAFNFVPDGTLGTHGDMLAIADYEPLFSLLGTQFGGDGETNFALPELETRLSIGAGTGPGLTDYLVGEPTGTQDLLLIRGNMPTNLGGTSQPFDNRAPSLGVTYVINAFGTFNGGQLTDIAMVWEFAGNFAPGGTLACNGQLVNIAEYETLFNLIGTTYGGNGVTNFALPDLRGRTIVGSSTDFDNGTLFGSETQTVGANNLPSEMAGPEQPFDNHGPSLILTYMIATQGIFPSRGGNGTLDSAVPVLGEIVATAANLIPGGFAECNGQLLSINQNQALFSLLGTTYGGNGQTTFALPDLRGQALVGSDSPGLIGPGFGTELITLTHDNIPDLNVIGTNGADALYAANEADAMYGLDGNDSLRGFLGNDHLEGGAGNDQLHGDGGADTMIGGTGDDAYWVDDFSDSITEQSGEGMDTVRSTISETLDANLENLILYGPAAADATGNGLANIIFGNGATNVIDGGGGADSMRGGGGDDQYVVDNTGDRVLEGVGAGTDTVTSSVSFVLGPNVENLILAGAAAINGTGNALANSLTGNGAANILNGQGAADTMAGGDGNDIYFVDNAGDSVIEGAGQGTDLVKSSVSFTLGDNVENLLLFGIDVVDATGNALANTLTGNGDSNTLTGLGGNDYLAALGGSDRLDGGTGADQMIGGSDGDLFVFSTALDAATNVDWIRDYSVAADTIALDASIFTALGGPGLLGSAAFHTGAAAADADDRIIYNSVNGFLYYDADGSGGGAQVQFARVAIGLAMTATDFIIES